MEINSNLRMGSLSIAVGSMFSGKTTWLLEKYHINTNRGKKCYPINYIEDTRYSETEMVTHDGKNIPCYQCKKIVPILHNDVLNSYDIFLINEGQFFEDLINAVKILLSANKKVYVSGLDGDFQQNKFGHILELIPICDKVKKLRAICHYCKDYGIFTKRLSDETAQKVIGVDNYISVCRKCLKCKPILVE
jgi:thymidine kinase|tara:strand:+ start:184 stop:756 length:573 start_codon:yes stop_codon:yes gene_type:complete